MNTKRYILASLMTFIYIFAFSWVLHGTILSDLYSQTANLWRSQAEMKNLFSLLFIEQIILTFLFGYIFIKGIEGKGILEGARYGLLISVFYSTHFIEMYVTQPIPSSIITIWILGTVVQFSLSGAFFAAIYKGSGKVK